MCVDQGIKSRLLRSAATIAIMTAASAGAASAQTANITASDANVLNLLAPFLTLNSTAVGQQTLQTNLQTVVNLNTGATLAQQQLAISDKNLLGNISNTVTGLPGTFGIAANLGGGLPAQAPINGITPQQPVGGLGAVLGQAYVNGVQTGLAGPLTNTVNLLNNAYGNLTSRNLGVAKNYFANGAATNPSTTPPGYVPVPAVAPAGYTLPTFNGLPNTTNSVYDLAYGVTNTQAGQDVYGSSRPVQVDPSQINQFDPTALGGLGTNPSFPSGHTTYAYTDSILLGMLDPQQYQSMLLRASTYGNSRIVLDVHYPLDIIASRSLASYELSQAFTNPLYMNNAATTGTSLNLPGLFNAASPELQGYLTTQGAAAGCGATIAACATSAANTASDPYVPSTANQALYQSRLTYGLPTLTLAQAPREAAPAGGPDASILLAPIYGGSTTAARTIAPTGGINGTLQTSTINQIIVDTETNALAAFYGTSLSYWSRINLYTASGYFGGVTGTLSLDPADVVTTNVTVGDVPNNVAGTLYANGRVTGTTTVTALGTLGGTGTVGTTTIAAGGTLAPGSATSIGTLNVAGDLTFAPGSFYNVRITPTTSDRTNVTGTAALGGTLNFSAAPAVYAPTQQYTILNATGGTTGAFTGISSTYAFLSPSLSANGQTLTVRALPFDTVAQTVNQSRVGSALTAASQVPLGANGAAIVSSLQQLNASQGRAALDNLSGEGIAAAQNAAFRAGSAFVGSIADQTAFWRAGDIANPNSITLGGTLPPNVLGYAPSAKRKGPIIVKDPVLVAVPRTWRVWGNGFGGGTSISGNAGLGTAGETGNFYGGALGLDYQIQPNWLVGIAAGGSDSHFSVGSRATSGEVTGFHIGVYSALDFGNGFYGQSSTSFGDYSNRTTRFVSAFGTVASAQEKGNFGSLEYRSRLEVGRYMNYGTFGVTPFVALEIASLRSNGFTENNVSGGFGNPALAVSGGQSASVPATIGARFNSTYVVGNGMVLTPVVSLAYLHEFAPERNLAANLVSLPGAAFLVNGARPARDAVQTKVGGQLGLANGVALFADFDGEFSDVSRTYAGRGGIKVSW